MKDHIKANRALLKKKTEENLNKQDQVKNKEESKKEVFKMKQFSRVESKIKQDL